MTKQQPKRGAGRLILKQWAADNSYGRMIYWCQLRCECGASFTTTKSAITKAERQRRKLFCAACQRRIKAEKANREYREPKPKAMRGAALAHPGEQLARKAVTDAPKLDADARKALRELEQYPARKARVLQVMTPYIRVQRAAGLEPELTRIVLEAVELVKREEVTGERADDGWTRENIHDGLCVVSYSHYAAPRDTGMM